MAGFMRKLLFEVGGSGMLHSYQVGLRTMCTKVIQVDRSGGKNIYHVHTYPTKWVIKKLSQGPYVWWTHKTSDFSMQNSRNFGCFYPAFAERQEQLRLQLRTVEANAKEQDTAKVGSDLRHPWDEDIFGLDFSWKLMFLRNTLSKFNIAPEK